MKIPKIIHQTYSTLDLPEALRRNVDEIKGMNPDWEHRLYDNAMVEDFIECNFDEEIVRAYRSIDPLYGAARADFFRYLLMYKQGGVYLDIKSGTSRPLSEVIDPDDTVVLVKWRNLSGEEHEGAGMSGPMRRVAGGEFQQWNIIAEPNHPFMEAAIAQVKSNIDNYRFWWHGVGRRSVIRLTGPIAYTLAIERVKDQAPYRQVRGENELGLVYSVLSNETAHRNIFSNHYSKNTHPIVIQRGWRLHAGKLYAGGKALMAPLLQAMESVAKSIIFRIRR
jgi:mannosyltransferase OCH1-like enzyme